MSNTVPIHSVQNTIELLADPIHFPITIGSDNFIITQQDQRNILDRRTWYLTHIPNQQLPSPNSHQDHSHLHQALLQQLVTILGQLQCETGHPSTPLLPEPFRFHYEKQTSTEDLRRVGIPVEPTLVKHIHFVVDRSLRDKGTVVEEMNLTSEENRMVCDEGNDGSSDQGGNALDRIRRMKEKGSDFW